MDNNKSEFGFKELQVWQKAVDFAQQVIETVEKNNSDRHHYRLLEQIDSASTSIAMNIAEGKGRFSNKEFVHFLYIARGSIFETITLLNIFVKMKWLEEAKVIELENAGMELAKMLNGLIKALKKNN